MKYFVKCIDMNLTCSNDVDQYKSPLIEDSYLKNHFLQVGESLYNAFSNHQTKQCNLQDVVAHDNCSISKVHIDGINHLNKVSIQSPQEELNKCKTIVNKNVIFQGNGTYNSKTNDSQTSLDNTSSNDTLTKFWQCNDVKTTSFLTEELILSSLESKAATTRLVEEITTPCSNSCRLIPISCNNYFCSKPSLDHCTNNIENQSTNVHIKSNQYFQNEASKSMHGVYKIENIDDIKLTFDGIQKTKFMNHNTSSCLFDEKEKYYKFFKNNEALINDKQYDMVSKETKYCTLEELDNSSSQVLCVPNHNVSQKKENMSACIKSRCSLQNEVCFKDSLENQGTTNDSSSTSYINQEVHSCNSFGIKNQSNVGSKKLNIPQHILQSVYERCDLDAIKNLGYAHLCDASHFKRKRNSKSLEHNNLVDDVKYLTLEEITSISSYSNDANLYNNEKSSIDIESMYYNFSRNEEDLGKENLYRDMCSPRLEEELNILASLARLDWKLAAISGRSLNSERNSLASQGGQLSSKSAQSAPAIMTHDGPSSTTLGKANLVVGKPKKNCSMPPRPSVCCCIHHHHLKFKFYKPYNAKKIGTIFC